MSQHRPTIRRPRRASRASRGMVFVTTLLVMLVLTLLGTAAVFTANTDLSIAGNSRSDLQAFSLGEAGVHEAMARVNMTTTAANTPRITPGGTLAVPDSNWSVTIVNKAVRGPNEVQTLTGAFGAPTALPVSTIVRYKREAVEAPISHCNADGCGTGTNAEVVRYHTSFGYAGAGVPTGATQGQPVLEFVSTVSLGDGQIATVGAEAISTPTTVNIPGPVTTCGRVSTTGGSIVDATNHPTQTPIWAGLNLNINTGSTVTPQANAVSDQLGQAGSFCPASGGNWGPPYWLPRQTAADRQAVFQQVFGMTADEMKAKADMVVTGPWEPPRNAVITGKKIIWIEPGTEVPNWNSNATIGSPTEPVIIVVRGGLSINSQVTVNGIIFTFGALTMGNSQFTLNGAMVSAMATLWDGAPYQTTVGGNAVIRYNPNIINQLSSGSARYAVSLWRVE